MEKSKWVWMPHSAHFICGSKCQFFLATKVGEYIVSTIGEYWPERDSREIHAKIYDPLWHSKNNNLLGDEYDVEYMKRFGFEEIGCNRKYETMVFKAKKSTVCKGCLYVIESGQNIDMDGYNEPEEAYKGHLKMCNKYSKK